MELRVFRSATHPEFLKYEVEPALVEAEMTTDVAMTVAQMMDAGGYSVYEVICIVKEALAAFGEE